MSEIQATDKLMRILAIIAGIVAIIDSFIVTVGLGILPYATAIGGVISIILSVVVIFLGIKPIHYTPTFLGIIGVVLIILGVLFGGIFVLFATFIGAIT